MGAGFYIYLAWGRPTHPLHHWWHMWHIGATPVSKLGGASSLILGSQVSLRVHYCKRDEVYFTTLRQQNNGRQNGLISRMLFSDLGKIMVNKVPFVGLRGGDCPNRPLGPAPDVACIISFILWRCRESHNIVCSTAHIRNKLYGKMYSSSGVGGGGAGSASAHTKVLICWKSGQNPWKSVENPWKSGQNLWKSEQKPYVCR